MNDAAVRNLAHQAGIQVNWENYAGEQRSIAPDVLRRVLSALKLPCATKDDVAESRRRLEPPAGLEGLPSLLTATAGQTIPLSGAGTKPLTGRVLLEDGAVTNVAAQLSGARLEIPAITQPGYHRLLIGDREIVLAVAPARATTIGDLAPNSRPWGLAAQVYGLRRRGDGGIGDAAGVARLAKEAADQGADALALSPVHALFQADPHHYGPYSPSSRLFLNPLYAAPESVSEHDASRQRLLSCGLGRCLHDWSAPIWWIGQPRRMQSTGCCEPCLNGSWPATPPMKNCTPRSRSSAPMAAPCWLDMRVLKHCRLKTCG